MPRVSRRRQQETTETPVVYNTKKPAPSKIKIDMLEVVKPLTKNQELFFESYKANKELIFKQENLLLLFIKVWKKY